MAGDSRARVGTYRRTVEASLERAWENVLDWEHLPWLHRRSFHSIEGLDAGPWGWRARVGLQPASRGAEILLELRLEGGPERYVARTLEGPGAGSEIWTRLSPRGAGRSDVEVEFHVPGVPLRRRAAVGAALAHLYARLWDEDEGMMRRREALLRRPPPRAAGRAVLDLGPLAALRPRLPLQVELAGRPFRVLDLDGELVAHSAVCPHRLGPLGEAPVEDGVLRCPWHGYRFDPRSGRSCDGRRLRIGPAPRVETRGGSVRLVWEKAAVRA